MEKRFEERTVSTPTVHGFLASIFLSSGVLFTILIRRGTVVKLDRLIRACSVKHVGTVRSYRQTFSDVFSVKNVLKVGCVVSPLLFDVALQCAINQEGVEMSATHPLLVCVDNVNLMGENINV